MSDQAEVSPGITVDKDVRFGKPLIKGTRVEVEFVLARLAGGLTESAIRRQYGVTREGVRAAIGYAAEIIAEERVTGPDGEEGPLELAPGITASSRVRFGKPVLKGTRVDAATVLQHLAAGDSPDVVAEAYNVPREGVLAALGYAHKVVASETVSAF